ncbi:hypothetical protein QQF64_016931 [Cirrhinus molitorella]|uniref:Uncharacterized protein n=1 Tax=Cirrhinus molitorella TaxID=172907 RepID=A0ABR3LP67_9TELE
MTGKPLEMTDSIQYVNDRFALACVASFQPPPLVLLEITNVTPAAEFILLPREKLRPVTPSPVLGVFWFEESPLCQRAAC